MRNRRLLYLLVPLTLVLWGAIVFRIFQHLKQKPDVTPVYSITTDLSSTKQPEDTFKLMANYSDPFLERRQLSSSEMLYSSSISMNSPAKAVKPTIIWPEVKYGGTIINKSNKNILYLVRVDNSNHLMKKGEEISQIKLYRVFKDSIVIQYKKKCKTILKEKL
jgi:hypothetical protein